MKMRVKITEAKDKINKCKKIKEKNKGDNKGKDNDKIMVKDKKQRLERKGRGRVIGRQVSDGERIQ